MTVSDMCTERSTAVCSCRLPTCLAFRPPGRTNSWSPRTSRWLSLRWRALVQSHSYRGLYRWLKLLGTYVHGDSMRTRIHTQGPDLEMAEGQGSPLLLSSYARRTENAGTYAGINWGHEDPAEATGSKSSSTRAGKWATWVRRHGCVLLSVTVAVLLVLAVIIVPVKAPELLDSIYDSAACPACLALLVPLQGLARRGDEAFTDFAVGFCIQFKVSHAAYQHVLGTNYTPFSSRRSKTRTYAAARCGRKLPSWPTCCGPSPRGRVPTAASAVP